MSLPDKYIDDLLRREYESSLPIGFAERVAERAMGNAGFSFWDVLFGMTPKVGVAFGAVAVVLAVFGFVGSAPDLIESVTHYVSLTELFPMQ